ncbi:MAG: hypothetical protein JWM80_5026 [Cyanobacteria bacterium RYN_339]|nr:hypothetical protein [Cyanobacteria bacterium RYN_339]
MASIHPIRPEPSRLHDRAADNLRFIRETMGKAASFTAVPGGALAFWGLSVPVAAYIASLQPTHLAWLGVWLAEALCSCVVLSGAMVHKARHAGQPLSSGPGRKFVQGVVPPFLAAAVLTVALARLGAYAMMPGVWLMLYGAGVVAGGANSVRSVPVMGMGFMALGAVALATPPAWGDFWMAMGFGALQAAFGMVIARKHGG